MMASRLIFLVVEYNTVEISITCNQLNCRDSFKYQDNEQQVTIAVFRYGFVSRIDWRLTVWFDQRFLEKFISFINLRYIQLSQPICFVYDFLTMYIRDRSCLRSTSVALTPGTYLCTKQKLHKLLPRHRRHLSKRTQIRITKYYVMNSTTIIFIIYVFVPVNQFYVQF